jgi:hypothetical protein
VNPLTEEQKALAADPEWIAYARRVVSSYIRRFPWHAEEFESAAMYGLVRAVGTFNPEGDCSFRSHVRWSVRHWVVDVFRRAAPKGHRHDYWEGKVPPTTEALHHPVDSGDDPVGWEIEYQDELEWLSKSVLGGSYGETLRLYYGHASASDLKGLGAATGHSAFHSSYRHRHAEALLRKRFAPCGRAAIVPRGRARRTP